MLVALIAALAACQPEGTGDSAIPETGETATEDAVVSRNVPDQSTPGATSTPQPAAADDSDCGADKVAARWLNALPSEDVKAAIRAAVGERSIRYYTQGDPITMDFSPSRLNVELGVDGRIKLFRCG